MYIICMIGAEGETCVQSIQKAWKKLISLLPNNVMVSLQALKINFMLSLLLHLHECPLPRRPSSMLRPLLPVCKKRMFFRTPSPSAPCALVPRVWPSLPTSPSMEGRRSTPLLFSSTRDKATTPPVPIFG